MALDRIRHLASCDKSTRDEALRLLHTWLPSQSQVSEEDMKKVWKGLFYSLWHADKTPVQSDLIDRLASLLTTLNLPLSIHYFSVFLLTMRREWPGIDALRLDKFYLLIRKFMYNFFLVLKNNSWDLEISKRLIVVLELEDGRFSGNGVGYHVASVFLEELRPFLPVRREIVSVLFEPFVEVMGRGLLEVKRLGGDEGGDGDAVAFGTLAVGFGFSKKFYELGLPLIAFRGIGKSCLPEAEVEGASEVVESVGNGSARKASKKSKKLKKVSGGIEYNENVTVPNDENSNCEPSSDQSLIDFNESVISNLQMQFEKVAAEVGLGNELMGLCDSPTRPVNGTVSKKRKRAKNNNEHDVSSQGDDESSALAKSKGKSAKKVKFSIKNNLVWKPQSPLPPQSLRLPPSVTPRGSALKKGIPPGPVREMPQTKKVKKRAKSLKKGRNGIKSISPAIKRLKKLQSLSI
ncbi:Ribosomal RNA processing protein 1-like B [Vitis vinifera]|uniref:Ribosomal RNA processing protein 1-like B n=1 Tax=Vitis vinifera TaxID=29760 RepID=A0A438GWV1_VITVI|nr:Ribosomal RNA processing protein 1-like B [Vitis vinifera]